MRKLIIAMLALSLMLCCLSAQAESTPMGFKDNDISLDFGDAIGASRNCLDLREMGVISYGPFVDAMNLRYCALDREGTIHTYPISGAMVVTNEPTVDQLPDGDTVDVAADAGAIKNDSSEYHVIVCDMDGNPVEGAVIQFCDDTTCAFQPTDDQGVATFSVEEQKVYDVHVLMVPEGYTPDDGVYQTLDTYSDVNIFLEKAA